MSLNYDELNRTLDVVERYIRTLEGFNRLYKYDTCPQTVSSFQGIAQSPSCLNQIHDLSDIVDKQYPLSGYHICELRDATEIVKDTLMLLSRGNWDPYYEEHKDDGLLYTRMSQAIERLKTEFSSWKFTYDDLSSSLLLDILSAFHLGEMAHKEQEDYAVAWHNHDKIYSRLTYQPGIDYSGQETNTLGGVSISTDYLPSEKRYDSIDDNPRYKRTSTNSYEFKTLKYIGHVPPKPMIGTLRFIGSQTMANIVSKYGITTTSDGLQVYPYDSNGKIRSDYDGWVFPNGVAIDNIDNQLSDALEFFNVNGKITPPDLNGFFKADPRTINTSSPNFSQNAYQLGLPVHLHPAEIKFNNTGFAKKTVDGKEVDDYGKITTVYPMIYATEGTMSTKTTHAGFNGNETNVTRTYTDSSGIVHDLDENKAYTEYFPSSTTYKTENISFTMSDYTVSTAGMNEEPYPKHNIVPVMIYIGGELDSFYYPKG